MLRAIAAGSGTAVMLHAMRYRWLLARTRAAESARLPVGSDGIVPGAEPFTLPGSDSHAALLVHGFGDTPQTVRQLGDYLNRTHGWTVRGTLLPGHGRDLRAFDRCDATAWRTHVHAEYRQLRQRYDTVVLVGLSMGGALTTIEAAADPSLPALVLLVPYLTPPARAERLAPIAPLINLMVPYLRGGDRNASIFDPDARERSLGAGASPPRRIADLVAVAHDARFAAADVQAPTLLIHSRSDYRIPVPLAERHPGFFTAARVCEQRWMEGSGHVITVDFCRETVWAETAAWLARHAGAPRHRTS
ncbi:MAG: alpha/beta fold hydrolase [Gemmatimonadaceae bacterium]|nr:alpha/beta fold hydrolase [Gemmatimonadaceae bacterium]